MRKVPDRVLKRCVGRFVRKGDAWEMRERCVGPVVRKGDERRARGRVQPVGDYTAQTTGARHADDDARLAIQCQRLREGARQGTRELYLEARERMMAAGRDGGGAGRATARQATGACLYAGEFTDVEERICDGEPSRVEELAGLDAAAANQPEPLHRVARAIAAREHL